MQIIYLLCSQADPQQPRARLLDCTSTHEGNKTVLTMLGIPSRSQSAHPGRIPSLPRDTVYD